MRFKVIAVFGMVLLIGAVFAFRRRCVCAGRQDEQGRAEGDAGQAGCNHHRCPSTRRSG